VHARAKFAFVKAHYFFGAQSAWGETGTRCVGCVGAWRSVTGLRGVAASRNLHRGKQPRHAEGCRQVDRIILHGEREPCKRRIVADSKPEVTRYPPNSIVDSSFNIARGLEKFPSSAAEFR